MSETKSKPRNLESLPVKRWAPEAIELAYQTWAGAADRNIAETCRLLAGLLPEAPPETSVARWRDGQGWEDRRRLELSGGPLVPSELYVARLEVAAPKAISLLQETIAGTTIPTAAQLDAAKHVEAAYRAVLLKSVDARRKVLPRTTTSSLPSDPTELEALESRLRGQRGSPG